MKKFENLTSAELWQLRKEITLGSIVVAHYENSFNFDPLDMATFFEGYEGFLWEIVEELNDGSNIFDHDNEDNLRRWFDCYDDLSWVRVLED